jgi:polar amino acid transport system substrate-binding protein
MSAARKPTTMVLVVAMLALLAAAAASVAAARPAQQSAGSLVFCTDLTYPPEEFMQNGKPAGSDIDIATEVGKRLGRPAKIRSTGFDGLIAALLGKKCDAIISGMNSTPDRAKTVAFVDYIAVGQSIMVQKGNPSQIKGLADLSGKSVSVQVGTTNKDFLAAQSKKFQKAGRKAIKVVNFPRDTDAAAALATGKVDAYFGDSPVVAYYIGKSSAFAFAGAPVNPIPVGIALRKQDTALKAQIAKAIDGMYADGALKRILTKWKMAPFMLKTK